MTKFLVVIITLILSQFPLTTLGKSIAFPPSTQNPIYLDLSNHPIWHKLLFYEKNTSGIKSAVTSDNFFLSNKGRTDPYAELEATINAFSMPVVGNANNHAQCLFRGRFLWLKKQLKLSKRNINYITCPEYENWASVHTTKSISIIFVTGYLGNPASYYGHILLKMNSHSKTKNKLDDVSVNFGAVVPKDENPFVYIFKGLFGGYKSRFSHTQFFYHNHNYGENEFRDIWEYELNLADEEVQLLLAHIWEVSKSEYIYYFLDKNCAYRMAEILELIEGVDTLLPNPLWAVPQTLIQNISKNKRPNGEPLIKNIKFHPSRQSKFYSHYSILNNEQKNTVSEIISNIDYLNDPYFTSIDIKSKHKVLDTLINYYQYIRNNDLREKDINNINYRKVLSKRYQLPSGKTPVKHLLYNSPHKGRKPSMINIGLIHNENMGYGEQIIIRPAYYDELDNDFGHVSNARLSMAEIKIASFNNTSYLRSFSIVDIESVNSRVTGYPGDSGDSWKLQLGITQQDLSCNDCQIFRIQGDVGKTTKISNKGVIGGYIGGGLNDNKNGMGKLFVKATLFSTFEINNKLRSSINIEKSKFIDGKTDDKTTLSLQARYRISSNFDMRLGFEKNKSREVMLSTSIFW